MGSTRGRAALVAIGVAAAVALGAAIASSAPWVTTTLGLTALVVLASGLRRVSSTSVAVAVGLLALMVATAQPDDTAFAPVEAAALVAVLLTGWWSVDDRWPAAVAAGSERGRTIATIALVASALLMGLVLGRARRIATAGVIGPVAGAAVVVSLAVAAWAAIQLDRQRRTATSGSDRQERGLR